MILSRLSFFLLLFLINGLSWPSTVVAATSYSNPTIPKTLGQVIDDQGVPLVGVTIRTTSEVEFYGITSDADGFFEWPKNRGDLMLSYVGYQTTVLTPAELATQGVVVLPIESITLETVTILAYQCTLYSGCSTTCSGIVDSECCFSAEEVIRERSERITEEEDFPTPLQLKLYPNPTVDWVQVKTIASQGELRLLSNSGQLLDRRIVFQQDHQFDLSDYPAGQYWISYHQAGKEVVTKAIVKMSW